MVTQVAAAEKYVPPAEFMNLFFDFAGVPFNSYPTTRFKGMASSAEALRNSESLLSNPGQKKGDLVLLLGSDIYVYDASGHKRL